MRALRQYRSAMLMAVCLVSSILLCATCFATSYSYKCPPLASTKSPYSLPFFSVCPSPIACMKRLADGAQVNVHQKTVVGFSGTSLFIEEADRSAGIKIDFFPNYPSESIVPGNLVSFVGTMATENGERVIIPPSGSNIQYDYTTKNRIASLSVSSRAITGWLADPHVPSGSRVVGLMPIGLLVQIYGAVYGSDSVDPDSGASILYLDDGTGLTDGTDLGFPGIRVYSNNIPGDADVYLSAVGVCTTITCTSTSSGTQFVVPVISTMTDSDVHTPISTKSPPRLLAVSGQVRLIGQSAPGLNVRVYSQNGSVLVANVTDTPTPFTLPSVSANGAKISASAVGYTSVTLDAAGGQSGLNLQLSGSPPSFDLYSDKALINICSSDIAQITCMLRDSEGKGIPNQQIVLATTMGTFTESGTRSFVTTSNYDGFVYAHVTASPDSAGIASVSATSPGLGISGGQINLTLQGPIVTVSSARSVMSQAGSCAVTGHLTSRGLIVPNAPIQLSTDLGKFQESGSSIYAATTDSNGDAKCTLVISSPGTAKVQAMYADSCGHQILGWTAVTVTAAPWYSQGAKTSPLTADLKGDGSHKKDVVIATTNGNLIALAPDATTMWTQNMVLLGTNSPCCAPMDIERSGLPCIFMPSDSQQKCYAFGHNGTPLAGWPTSSDFIFTKCSATVADTNLDGSLEVIAGDACCYVFSWNPTGDWTASGTPLPSSLWVNLTGTTNTAIYGSTCAVGSITGGSDVMPDVVVGTNGLSSVFAFPGDAWGDHSGDAGTTPLYVNGWPRSTNGRAESSPAIGDVDGDGLNDMAIGSDDDNLYVWLSSTQSWVAFPCGGMVQSSPALADLDGDGKLDIIVGSDSGRIYAFNWLGQAVAGWSGGIQLNQNGVYAVESSPVVGDVNGDGRVEVVVGCNDGNIYAIYSDGYDHKVNGQSTGPIAWIRSCVPSGQTSAQVIGSPVIDDIDADGLVDVVAASDKGVFVFHTNAPYTQSAALNPWPTFHHDNQRTGCATSPHVPTKASIQGLVTKNGFPVLAATVTIYMNDGSPVNQPGVTPATPRIPVMTVGTAGHSELCQGAYSINQLDPNQTYKLQVVSGSTVKTVSNLAVTTGLLRVDIAL